MQSRGFGFTAFGILLIFGAAMAMLAALTLLLPGTALDFAWRLNPVAQRQLADVGRPAGILLLDISVVLAIASVGWFRRRRWGYWLSVVLIGIQVLGNMGNMMMGQAMRGLAGAAISLALLVYLLTPAIRHHFYRE